MTRRAKPGRSGRGHRVEWEFLMNSAFFSGLCTGNVAKPSCTFQNIEIPSILYTCGNLHEGVLRPTLAFDSISQKVHVVI